LFGFSFFIILFCSVPCGRLSWLLVNFWAHINIVNRILAHRMGRGNFEGKQANHCQVYRDSPRSSGQRRLNRSRCSLGCGLAWAQSIMCYMGGSDPPWEWAILVDRGVHCKVQALSAASCAKTAEPFHLPFRLWGLEWAEGCTSSIVFARWRQCALIEGHVAVTCRITFNHPSTAAMHRM